MICYPTFSLPPLKESSQAMSLPPDSEQIKSAGAMVHSVEPVPEKEIGSMEEITIDVKAEKKLLRKLDLCLMSLFGLLYCLSVLGTSPDTENGALEDSSGICGWKKPNRGANNFLLADRSNIGNAGLTSFESDLGLVGNQYGAAISIVFSTYIFFEPIWTVLFKVLSPKYTMAVSVVGWAAITMGTAFVKNFDQLAAMRVLLGFFEAGVIPNITMYITMAYQRDEYAVRKAYVQIAAAISGAFGGLLAYGLIHIEGTSLKNWQWLYLVESCLSFLLVPVTLLMLPNNLPTVWWLKKHEKELAKTRAERNLRVFNSEEKFAWSEVRRALTDKKVYIQAVAHFGCNTTLFSLTSFMPKIIAGLGITTKINTQLLTVPVYFTAGTSFYLLARWADKTKQPSRSMFIGLCFLIVGYILLIAIENTAGRFFALFILSMGLYVAGTMNMVWCQQTHSGYFKRAICTAFIQCVGNIAGAVIGFIFTSESAPRYLEGMWFSLGVSIMSMGCLFLLRFVLKRENKKKRELIAQGAPDEPELGDRNPHFLYYI